MATPSGGGTGSADKIPTVLILNQGSSTEELPGDIDMGSVEILETPELVQRKIKK